MKTTKNKSDNKSDLDNFHAKLGFFISLGFWIPLFNVAICIVGIIVSGIALKNIIKYPSKFGGIYYAITGLILALTGIVLTIIGLIIFLTSESICLSAVCSGYF